MSNPDRPSLMDARNAVSAEANDQRTTRNLYKRVFRGLNRRLRKGDTAAGQEAINLLAQGTAAGVQMTGIPSVNKETNAAGMRIMDRQRTNAQANGVANDGTNGQTGALGGPSWNPNNRPEIEESMPTGGMGGPNDGGNVGSQISATQDSVAPVDPGFNPNTATSQILSQRRAELAPGASPIFSSRDPNATPSSPGLAPLDTQTEGPTGDTILRGDDGSIIGRGSTRPLPEPEPYEAAGPPKPEPFADFSPEFIDQVGSSLAGANRTEEGVALATKVSNGEIDINDLTADQRELYEEGDEFLLYQKERDDPMIGKEEALSRAGKRMILRERDKKSADRAAQVADGAGGPTLAFQKPRNGISKILDKYA